MLIWIGRIGAGLLVLVLVVLLAMILAPRFLDRIYYRGPVSDHFDGEHFFNADDKPTAEQRRSGISPFRFIRFALGGQTVRENGLIGYSLGGCFGLGLFEGQRHSPKMENPPNLGWLAGVSLAIMAFLPNLPRKVNTPTPYPYPARLLPFANWYSSASVCKIS